MDENDYFDELEDFADPLDDLIALFEDAPKESVKILNIPKYKKMLAAASQLRYLLNMAGEAGKVEVDILDEFDMGSISAEITSFTVYEPVLFGELVRGADNFDIYPLVNGNIKLDIAFQSVLITIG